MSSYTVGKTTIDALITAAVKWSHDVPGGFRYHWHYGAGTVDAATATRVGQMLWHANWYHADGWALDADWIPSEEVLAEPVYEYEPLPGVPDSLIVLRVIANYVYQTADEPEEWRPTEAFGFVHALEGAAINLLLRDKELPWGLGDDDRDLFLRFGQPDPPPEPLDVDNADWVMVDARLRATGIPFKSESPSERRNSTEAGSPVPAGRWLTWPPDLGSALVVVRLYGAEADAVAAFTALTQTGVGPRPRFSAEAIRQGRTVLFLSTDHWNTDLDVWLDRLRTAFAPRDDYWSASDARLAATAPVVVVGWSEERQHWDISRLGERSLAGVQNLTEAQVAAEQREVWLMIADEVYAEMVGRGAAPAERPSWAMRRPAGAPRLP